MHFTSDAEIRRYFGNSRLPQWEIEAFVVRAYLLQTHEMLFDALAEAFRVLGGVPRRGIFDNMRTIQPDENFAIPVPRLLLLC